MPMEPIFTEKRYRLVIRAIKKYILDNDLSPGDKLPSENDLADSLKVGRSSVREAVKSMEVLGVLESKAGEGIFVRSFTFDTIMENLPYRILFNEDDLAEIAEIRKALELYYLQKLDEISDERIKKLEKTLKEMEKAFNNRDQMAYANADEKFHRILLEPIKNNLLKELISIFWKTLRKAEQFTDISGDNFEKNYRRHENIFNALKERNFDKLYDLVEIHYEHVKTFNLSD